ncbi:hypothetical protein M378DRAFT_1001412 [Amanita muscaria Koide BX008]|uniref:Uncharacterized protein n=1 Tax=Amanita muscaria (strain Koide BX008) TaxID=946122 RepID=A0A0C2S9Y8_AMAMK|nr:hypothetical protein M378DRAFT_1001412 [Amanita muscaria Koide BX008]
MIHRAEGEDDVSTGGPNPLLTHALLSSLQCGSSTTSDHITTHAKRSLHKINIYPMEDLLDHIYHSVTPALIFPTKR